MNYINYNWKELIAKCKLNLHLRNVIQDTLYYIEI